MCFSFLCQIHKCVNRIFRGQISFGGKEFKRILDNVKHPQLTVQYHNYKPHMHTIRLPKQWTVLLFPSGRFRIMGKNIYRPHHIVNYLTNCISHSQITRDLDLQSETFVLTFHRKINLYKYSFASRYSDYEPEIFPSLRLKLWSPIMVNLFASGKAVVMGREARLYLEQIYTHIVSSILPVYGF